LCALHHIRALDSEARHATLEVHFEDQCGTALILTQVLKIPTTYVNPASDRLIRCRLQVLDRLLREHNDVNVAIRMLEKNRKKNRKKSLPSGRRGRAQNLLAKL
jgi:hypothetical protein